MSCIVLRRQEKTFPQPRLICRRDEEKSNGGMETHGTQIPTSDTLVLPLCIRTNAGTLWRCRKRVGLPDVH